MKITEILKDIEYVSIKNSKNLEIESLSLNSKENNMNGIFFCISGTREEGHNYAKEAIDNGAKCLVVERFLELDVMQILVKNTRRVMTKISAKFYDIENSQMKFIGITGTNGKTTSTFLIKYYLTKLNKNVGLIGTEGIYFNGMMLPSKLTTPDPLELYKIIHEMKLGGVEYVVMEVSAHAIALNKVDGINFDVAGLTNITEDHLDFFNDMQNYARCKLSLFSSGKVKNAILNIDDDYTFQAFPNLKMKKSSISLYNDADFMLMQYDFDGKMTSAKLKINSEFIDIKTNLIGKYNLANILMALAVLNSLDFPFSDIENVARETEIVVPGRFNLLKTPSDFSIIIDFAHTPDGMEKILKTARELGYKRLITVFGCGGDRDKNKRHIMGTISEKYSDFTIVTSDNPRTENPNLIIRDITENMKRNYKVEKDRYKAIFDAIDMGKSGDAILILGKGAENYQEVMGKRYSYSDYDVVDQYFKLRAKKVTKE